MTKIQMPEPVAYQYENPYSKKLTLNWRKSPAPGSFTPLVTEGQAEAYAEARVSEALEAAAKICDDRAMKNEAAVSADEADEASSLRSAAWQIGVCARDIRALIPEPCLNSP